MCFRKEIVKWNPTPILLLERFLINIALVEMFGNLQNFYVTKIT